MASTNAVVPVPLGGRYQNVAATNIVAIGPSDVIVVGPVAQIIIGGAGNLSLGMYNGTNIIIPVVAGQVLFISPKFIRATGTTATQIFVAF